MTQCIASRLATIEAEQATLTSRMQAYVPKMSMLEMEARIGSLTKEKNRLETSIEAEKSHMSQRTDKKKPDETAQKAYTYYKESKEEKKRTLAKDRAKCEARIQKYEEELEAFKQAIERKIAREREKIEELAEDNDEWIKKCDKQIEEYFNKHDTGEEYHNNKRLNELEHKLKANESELSELTIRYDIARKQAEAEEAMRVRIEVELADADRRFMEQIKEQRTLERLEQKRLEEQTLRNEIDARKRREEFERTDPDCIREKAYLRNLAQAGELEFKAECRMRREGVGYKVDLYEGKIVRCAEKDAEAKRLQTRYAEKQAEKAKKSKK